MDTGGSIGNTIFLTKGCRRFILHSFSLEDSCGEYAIRPYPDGRMDARGSIGNPIFLTKGFRRFILHSSSLGNICGAYAIRPYPDGRKMITVGACFAVGYEKQAAFRGCYGVGGGKCGAFDCFTVVVCINRTAFSCPHVGAY